MSATKLREEATTPFSRAVAAEVNAMMGRQGRLNMTDLAEMTGLKYATLRRCLLGQRPFSIDQLEVIAAALRCEVRDFLVAPTGPAEAPTTHRLWADRGPVFAERMAS